MSTYPPAPTANDLVRIRPVDNGVPSPITRYVPVSQLPVGGAGVSTVTDGVHTVTNASTIDFTAGATVTNLGGGVAGVSISGGGTTSTSLTLYDTHGNTLTNVGTVAVAGSGTVGGSGTIGTISGFGGGGGGGSYVGVGTLGVAITGTNPGTIYSTGTIEQPAVTADTGALGVTLAAGSHAPTNAVDATGASLVLYRRSGDCGEWQLSYGRLLFAGRWHSYPRNSHCFRCQRL